MIKGNVKWFDVKKGYGFIAIEEGKDVFVHYSSIGGNGFKTLEEGQPVELELEENAKGLSAKNVTLV